MTKLWHDDIRPPPDDGWVWARTNKDAQEILRGADVEEISMDHDLGLHHIEVHREAMTEEQFQQVLLLRGNHPDNGLQLVRWMCANGIFPKKITIHSWNPVGAKAMQAVFRDAGVSCIVEPFRYQNTRKRLGR